MSILFLAVLLFILVLVAIAANDKPLGPPSITVLAEVDGETRVAPAIEDPGEVTRWHVAEIVDPCSGDNEPGGFHVEADDVCSFDAGSSGGDWDWGTDE